MEKQVVNEYTIQLIDDIQFGDGVRFDDSFDERVVELQGQLVERCNETINALVKAYDEPWCYSREVVADLVTAIREINKFDFVVEESHFSEVFRANETLNEVFVVKETEELSHEELVDEWIKSEDLIDEDFGRDFI